MQIFPLLERMADRNMPGKPICRVAIAGRRAFEEQTTSHVLKGGQFRSG